MCSDVNPALILTWRNWKPVFDTGSRPSSSHSSLIMLYGHHRASSLWKSLKNSHPPWTWSTLSDASRQTQQTSSPSIGLHLSACVSCTYLYNVSIDTGGVFLGGVWCKRGYSNSSICVCFTIPLFLLIFALDLWEANSMKRRKKKKHWPTNWQPQKKCYAKCWDFL